MIKPVQRICHSDGLVTVRFSQLVDVPELRVLGYDRVINTLCDIFGVPSIDCLYITGTEDQFVSALFDDEDEPTVH